MLRFILAATVLTVVSVFALAKCIGEDIAERAHRKANDRCERMLDLGYEEELLPPGCRRASLSDEEDIYPDDNP